MADKIFEMDGGLHKILLYKTLTNSCRDNMKSRKNGTARGFPSN